MPLKSGDRVDRYVIDSLLGTGGMGEVYRAHDARLQRSVALKIVRRDPSHAGPTTTGGAVWMLREARAAAALEHPNVVAIYDVGQLDSPEELRGTTYLAMELVKGSTLRAFVGDPSVPMKARIRWLIDVARALAAAHAAGLVHRDIKPDNVMVREDGLAKVLDFGVAKRTREPPVDGSSSADGSVAPTSTGVGAIVGTPMYMAPEQVRGEPLDGRADQFAWGVVAYELLSGRAPWAYDAGPVVLIGQILATEPKRLEETSELPAEVVDAIMRTLSKTRSDRFASMDQVVEAIGGSPDVNVAMPARMIASNRPAASPALGEQTMPLAPAPSTHTRASPRARTRGWPIAGAVVLGLALVGSGFALRARVKSTGGAPIAAAAKGCESQRECVDAHGGEPWVCRASDRECVAVASQDCEAHFEAKDLQADDMVWLGVLIPKTGPRANAYRQQEANTFELARRDFASVGGIPGAADGKLRPLGVVVCDTARDARASANNLADLEVPGVLGFPMPVPEAIDVVRSILLPKGILAYELYIQSALTTRIPQPAGAPRLVWRLTASADQDGEALAHLVSDYVEPWLHRPGGPLVDAEPTKLAIVRSASGLSTGILDAATSVLRLNGKPLVENSGLFRQFTFRDRTASPSEQASIVAEIAALAPHVIAYADGAYFERTFLEPIERSWRAAYRPIYVSQNVLDGRGLRDFVGKSAERRHRILSIDLPANTDENFQLVLHYNETFDPKITPGTSSGIDYDAFYVAAYAAAAVRKSHITGLDMAEAMRRFGGDAPPVGVGPSHIFEAYDVLRRGEALHLVGAGTQLDFDYATGEVPNDFAIYCLGVDRTGRVSESIESGLRFDHVTKQLEGRLACP